MKQEEQDLIFKDLCARLPYGVKAYVKCWSKYRSKWIEDIYTVVSVEPRLNDIYVSNENGSVGVILKHSDYTIEPYLFPLSSMTEEQKKECPVELSIINAFINGKIYLFEDEELTTDEIISMFDWLNKNHFDYRGLIEKELALDATGMNVY